MTGRLSKSDYDKLTQPRVRLVMNEMVRRVSVSEDLLTILQSPAGDTIEHLLENLAALVIASDANRSVNPDNMGRKSADSPAVNVAPAQAARRLLQADRALRLEAESIAAHLHYPWRQTDLQRSKQRVACTLSDCSRFQLKLPKWVRAGESWLNLAPVCVGERNSRVCGGRLTDV